MAQSTIEQFATELKMPAGALIEQLAAAGVGGKKHGDDLSEQDKTRLLDYLRKQHGGGGDAKQRITLTRKQTSEIKAAGTAGKSRTIQVEVRKKRVLVRRDEGDTAVAAAPVEEAVIEAAPEPVPVPAPIPEPIPEPVVAVAPPPPEPEPQPEPEPEPEPEIEQHAAPEVTPAPAPVRPSGPISVL